MLDSILYTGEVGSQETYPVAAAADTDTLSAHAQREDLCKRISTLSHHSQPLARIGISSELTRTNNPSNRPPRKRKMNDKDPNKNYSNPSRSAVLIKVALVRANDSRNDKVADGHARGTGDEDLLSADLVDPQHGGDGEEELDDADDAGGEEVGCVAGELHVFEDVGTGVVSIKQYGGFVNGKLCE